MDQKILCFVKKVRARLKEQAVIDGIIMSVIVGLFLALIVLFCSLWISMYYAIPASAGMVLLSFVAGVVIGIRRTPTLENAALMADSKGYREKFVTALMLVGREDAFSRMQKNDAVRNMELFSVKKEFPIKLSWRKGLLLLLLAAAFCITAGLDTPARRLAVTKHDVKKDSLAEIEKIDKLKKEIEKAEKLSDIEKSEIKDQLEQAASDMRKAESYEELKKAEDIITKKMEMKAKALQEGTAKEALENAAAKNREDQAKKVEEAMKEAEYAMEQAASNDEKNKKDAYEKLNKLAEVSGDEELKKAAKNFKESDYSNSDYLAANQALENAKDGMKESDMANNSTDNSRNKDRSGAGGQNENSSQQGSQNQNGNDDRQGSQGQNKNNGGQGSQGQNENNGGQGSRSQNGNSSQQGSQGQNGNGSQQGSQGQSGNGQGNNGTGGNGSGSGTGGGPGWNRGSKEGREGNAKVNENVTIPDGEAGNDDNLSGKANGNDSSTKQKSSQANTWSGNKVSYGQVSGEYKEKAYKKVNGSNYPVKMKEKIRDYFDGLD